MSRIGVIIGSVRPKRNCVAYAKWVADVAKDSLKKSTIELIDIKDYNLRPDVEPGLPKYNGAYADENTKIWSSKIASLNAFVFVAPEYNFGISPGLKTALDILYLEWTKKPAVIVTFGNQGGTWAGEHLQTVLSRGLEMQVVEKKPGFPLNLEYLFGQNASEEDIRALHAKDVGELHEAFGQLQELLEKQKAEWEEV